MSEKISRRKFLKFTGLGAAAAAVLTGCGPASRYVIRKPYASMPEYNQTGFSTYYATTCRECAAGCGLILRTFEGRAIKAEGNPNHPVNRGKLCQRGLTSVQGLYNPDRIREPRKAAGRGSGNFIDIAWDEALNTVSNLLGGDPKSVAFLMGYQPDHLYDLVKEITDAMGAPAPVRYGALGMFEARATLIEAMRQITGQAGLPFFDLGNADLVFSFGANFLETWLSPLAYSRGYGNLRQGTPGKRGYLVSFEARQSVTSSVADEWIPLIPGSEGVVAAAIGRLIAEINGQAIPTAFATVDLAQAVEQSGVSEEKLHHLAYLFARAEKPLALPGGAALSHTTGLMTARAILALNAIKESSLIRLAAADDSAASLQDVQALVNRMNQGEIHTLFIHSLNPVFELPAALGFSDALKKVKAIVSFAAFPDETSVLSDWTLPDHTGLESFGYQRVLTGSDRPALSALQPVVVPLYNTRATADVLLEAARMRGGALAAAAAYQDEVDFIQQKIRPYIGAGGFYTAPEILTFWSSWLQYGGWWKAQPEPIQVDLKRALEESLPVAAPVSIGRDKFRFHTYPTQMGDGSGANRPWLQETPDPMTTVMWNSWIEIHPETAAKLGLRDDDVVKVSSSAGELEASVYLYPAIRPDTVAIPFGQGHTALGRFAEARGANPAALFEVQMNEVGDLAYGDLQVSITPTGKRRPLARYESREGVYGDHAG
ncbi:anaerobic dehydrogenases, typically selenocysteine-containing [Longilinea arvoryzae]|uniref:Anaerobic dehydrogenases, typically selenocysteine-containing n=1 Tax=Longilinea arvoryzae TaxID=360412 RepID=A0A0S7B9J4_9CHLR|nr:molybdopterin dinucleotide binding domain-containing protein [Longilinea arvoryzae]GAP14055.1 anaerobic dehydrogenases, typically selenocysteine-containing [Longilinea arvoryzae]